MRCAVLQVKKIDQTEYLGKKVGFVKGVKLKLMNYSSF